MAKNKKQSATNTGNSGKGNNTGNANTGTAQPGSSTPLWSSINNVLQNLPAGATQQQISQAIANKVGPAAPAIQAIQVAKNAKNQPNTSGTPQAGSGGAGMGVYNDIVQYMDKNKLSYFSGSVPDTEKQKMLDENWKEQYAAGKQWINDVNTNLIDRVNSEMDKLNKKALGQVEGTAEQKWKQEGLGGSDTLIGETGTLSLGAPKYSPLGYIPPKREIADNKHIQLTREQDKQPSSHHININPSGNQQRQYFGYSTLGTAPGSNQIVGIATGNSTHNGLANLLNRAFDKKEAFEQLADQAKKALEPNLTKGLNPLFIKQYNFTIRSYDPNKGWLEQKENLTLPQALGMMMVAVSDANQSTCRVNDIVDDAILEQNKKFPIVVGANGDTYINKYFLQESGNRNVLQQIASDAINNLMGQQTTNGLQNMSDKMKENNADITTGIVKDNLNRSTGLAPGEYHYLITDVLMTSLAEALTGKRNGKLPIKSTTLSTTLRK